MGPVKKLVCFADKISNLEIDVEDTAEVILRFASGAIGEIHLDYLQRFYQRNFEFFGETGTVIWDVNLRSVMLKSKGEAGEQVFPLEEGYDLNAMYIEEIKHFLACVAAGSPTITPLQYGAAVTKLISLAKQSAQSDAVIYI